MMKKPITAEAAFERMASLCARSEQCEADIRQKLFRMGIPPAQAAEIIDSLIGQRFIDNERFARAFANDKCRFSGWGRHKIRMALSAKRIGAADIALALDSIDPGDYTDALSRVASAKARGMDLNGPEGRDSRIRLYRHILSRGFESDFAMKAVREMAASQIRNSQTRKESR